MHARFIGSAKVSIIALILSASLLLFASGSARAIEFTTDTTIHSTDYPGQPIIVTGCTLTIDCTPGEGFYDSTLIRSSGVLTHPAGNANGLWLSIANDVTINVGSSINVNGKGHPGQGGPGGGASGMGGTHGGTGGGSDKATYGQIPIPTSLGSGGGDTSLAGGGAGGGLIRMHVGGTLTVSGSIQALGSTVTSAGGGSGGSIAITCATLTGSGSIYAYGGNGSSTSLPAGEIGGGGGGGRIAVYYDTSTYSGTMLARGGTGSVSGGGSVPGGAGTVYRKLTGSAPTLRINGDTVTGTTLMDAPARPARCPDDPQQRPPRL